MLHFNIADESYSKAKTSALFILANKLQNMQLKENQKLISWTKSSISNWARRT